MVDGPGSGWPGQWMARAVDGPGSGWPGQWMESIYVRPVGYKLVEHSCVNIGANGQHIARYCDAEDGIIAPPLVIIANGSTIPRI